MTIFFKQWEIEAMRNYILFLFTKRNYLTGRTFKKEDTYPRDNLYFRNFIRFNYPFDTTTNLEEANEFIISNLGLSLDKTLNIFDYLLAHNISQPTSSVELLEYSYVKSDTTRPKSQINLPTTLFLQLEKEN